MPKVLIAEDDPELSRMYERAFHLSGYEVEMANDGKIALERLRTMEEKPSAVVLDSHMPNASGTDVLKAMKEDPALAHVPVAILTNSVKSDSEEAFMALGANLFMVKLNTDIKAVVDKINTLLGRT
jgi:CheY-like chemotaxis protein